MRMSEEDQCCCGCGSTSCACALRFYFFFCTVLHHVCDFPLPGHEVLAAVDPEGAADALRGPPGQQVEQCGLSTACTAHYSDI
jgi:hypothetical protein